MNPWQDPATFNPLLPGVAVVDPRLAAPRGEQWTNAYIDSRRRDLDDDENWPKPPGQHHDDDVADPVESKSAPISTSNIGFKLLQKMGWKEGKGLGKQEDGIVEPVQAGVDAGVRLGLGKQEEDDSHTAEVTAARRRLEIEVAAQEDEEAARRREAVAEVLQKRAEDVKEMLQTFYCEVCDKQYAAARQLEEHLSSYDHHHRKRLAETKAAMAERNRGERQRREQKAADKEMARLQKQIEAAHQRSRQHQPQAVPVPPFAADGGPPLPPLPSDESPPPLPPGPAPDAPPPPSVTAAPAAAEGPSSCGAAVNGGASDGMAVVSPGIVLPGTTGIAFGLGSGRGTAARGGLSGPGGRLGAASARGGLKRSGAAMGLAARPLKAAAAPMAGFGLDSDEEEADGGT